VKDKDKKRSRRSRCARRASAAYLMESGRGHEINLPKGAKLELELDRAALSSKGIAPPKNRARLASEKGPAPRTHQLFSLRSNLLKSQGRAAIDPAIRPSLATVERLARVLVPSACVKIMSRG